MEDKYEVWLRDKRTGNRRSIILWAQSFSDAEQLVMFGANTRILFDLTKNEEIIRIDKEYDAELLTHDEQKRNEFLLSIEPDNFSRKV